VAMLVSISLGLARDGLLGAILFKAWVDMLGDVVEVINCVRQISKCEVQTSRDELIVRAND
jgi:hypothetical protein